MSCEYLGMSLMMQVNYMMGISYEELMDELAKIIRVIRKLEPNSPHHCLLTLDATTGQNAINQVEIFKEIAEEIDKFDIYKEIDFLEKKLIDNMNEKTYEELIQLKKRANGT